MNEAESVVVMSVDTPRRSSFGGGSSATAPKTSSTTSLVAPPSSRTTSPGSPASYSTIRTSRRGATTTPARGSTTMTMTARPQV